MKLVKFHKMEAVLTKLINPLIICFVLASCQEKKQTNQEGIETLSNESELVLKSEFKPFEYSSVAKPGNWFNIRFDEFIISIDNMDLQLLTKNEYNQIHKDTAVFDLMPGSDAFANKIIKISQFKFDKIELFEKMDEDSDWKKIESLMNNFVYIAGPQGSQFLKIILYKKNSDIIMEKIIILEDATSC